VNLFSYLYVELQIIKKQFYKILLTNNLEYNKIMKENIVTDVKFF